MVLQLRFGEQPPEGAIRAFGARLIAGEVAAGGSGMVWDRVDAQPDEPRLGDPTCPSGKTAFADWVNAKGFPFIKAYVKRLGLPEGTMAMIDGQYAVHASTHGRSGYLYVGMFEMPEGVVPPVVETPIPPPYVRPGSQPHPYLNPLDSPDALAVDRYFYGKRPGPCAERGCGEHKTARIHKKATARV